MERAVGSHSPEAVLEHLDWVQALARRLVDDPERARDLGQEAALAALRRPPSADRPLRAWLGGVVRNLARRERRSEGRRAEREAHCARADELPSTVALLERVAVERRVVETVLALDEPYRTTVLLRWFEGLPPRAIARRTGLPEATVKTRLRRALALLRAALDRDFGGDGRAWLGALLPNVSSPGAVGAAATGALVLNAKALLVSVSLVACAGLGWWWSAHRAAVPQVAVAPVPEAEELVTPAALAVQKPAGDAPQRVPLAPSEAAGKVLAPALEPVHAETAALREVQGRVVDLELAPVADVEVHLRLYRAPGHGDSLEAASGYGVPGAVEAAARTDADGHFRLAAGRGRGRLDASDTRHAGVLDSLVSQEEASSTGHTLVVGRRRTIEGRVVDEAGNPVLGAELAYATRVDLHRQLGAVLDRSLPNSWSTRSDADGGFVLEGVPELPEAVLDALEVGHARARLDLPAHGDQRVLVVLPALASERGLIAGRVLDRHGEPAEGALVSVDGHCHSVRSDASGRFQLRPTDADARRLMAFRAGSLPGVFERAAGERWPVWIELVLGSEPLAITGRVVDEKGLPVRGATVRLADATRLQVPLDGSDPEVFVQGRVESVLRGAHSVFDEVQVGPDGRFEIGGLLPRDYRLFLAHETTLATAEAGPFPAGARDVEVVLPRAARSGPIAGRLLSSAGEPLAGVTVQPQRMFGRDAPEPVLIGASTVSDAQGRFGFAELVYDDLHLGLFGGPVASFEEHPLPTDCDPDDVRLVVRTRCHFQVQLEREPARADGFALQDEQGAVLPLYQADGTGSSVSESGDLEAGRSQVLMAREGAATLVLYRADVEVERVPIRLVPGEINRLRL